MILVLVLATGAQQQIPDAPSATAPQQTPFPTADPNAPATARPATRPPLEERPAEDQPPEEAPPAEIRPALPAVRPATDQDSRDEMFTLVTDVAFVIVPVTVKDDNGRLVDGLLRRDFTVFEDGDEQSIRLFTSDPFPLSAAVVLDVGVSDLAMRRINKTFSGLAGAFSPFDEVTLFTYGSTVEQRMDWSQANDRFATELRRQQYQGRSGGVPVVSGPMVSGPTINGRPFDPGTPSVRTVRRESRVLNDAVLAAALELSKRDRARRKVIFIVSDGAEEGSTASYNDVLKVLLTNEIAVYAIAVDASAIPGYRTLAEIRMPGFGRANILPKYASATGGDVFPEFSREAIERAYARVASTARNQYTLGYTTRATAASNYRQIEVRVHRGGLRVFAKDGYYPLPPARPSSEDTAQPNP